jgi:hypothetical protein
MARFNEKWSKGKQGGTVVSDARAKFTIPDGRSHNDVDYYGGYLVAESIPKQEYVNLIALAPDLYNKLEEIERVIAEWPTLHADGDYLHGWILNSIRELLNQVGKEIKPQPDAVGELAQSCQRLREIIRNEFSSDGQNWQAIKKYQADVDQALVAIRNVRGESEGQHG